MFKESFLSIITISCLFSSCDENNILESDGTAEFIASGLPTLPSKYTYQTWLLVGGSYVSTGTFNIDNKADKTTITEFSNINNNDLTNANGVAITVEFTGTNAKSSPSDMIIMAGDFVDNKAILSTSDSRSIYAEDLKADYIIDAPTATDIEKTDSEQNGIWFSTDIDQSTETPGLVLPYNQNDENKTLSNLKYQGWLYTSSSDPTEEDIILNMGSFTKADNQDNLNNYSGSLANFTPILPGNDFINITNQNVESPTLELLNQEVVITARPNEDTSNDSSVFPFILFKGTIDSSDGSIPIHNNNYSATFTKK